MFIEVSLFDLISRHEEHICVSVMPCIGGEKRNFQKTLMKRRGEPLIFRVGQISMPMFKCFSNILHHALSNLNIERILLVLQICVHWGLYSIQKLSFLSYSITSINTRWLFGFQFFTNLIF